MELPVDLTLENERVRLSPLTKKDHDQLVSICLPYPKLTQYSPYLLDSPEAIAAFIENRLSQKAAGLSFPFMIYDKDRLSYAGSSSYLNISFAHSRLEIGSTFITPPFQGTGLNSHMKQLMLSYAFDKLNMEITGIRVRNADKSISATLRIQSMVRENGDRAIPSTAYRDREIVSSRINGQWSAIRW